MLLFLFYRKQFNFNFHLVHLHLLKEAVSINALPACVYIYIQQLSSFRAPMLWFINLTVTTCHIQYTSEFMSIFHERMDKTRKCSKSAYENGRQQLRIGVQSINTERASTHVGLYSNTLFTNIYKQLYLKYCFTDSIINAPHNEPCLVDA